MLDYKTDFFILFGVSVREQTHCRPLLQRVLQHQHATTDAPLTHSRLALTHSRLVSV